MFRIETSSCSYNLEFCHLQLNITSRCNMKCKHCRGSYEDPKDLSLEDINAVLDFCQDKIQKDAAFLISGGEPLLHPKFKEIMHLLKDRGVKYVSITTNGSFLTNSILSFLDSLKFNQLRVSISLDGLNECEVNEFRQCSTAFKDAIRAIEAVAKYPRIISIVRTTIQKKQLKDVPELVDFVAKNKVNIFSISSIIPSGRAREDKSLWFDPQSKKKLLELIEQLSLKYPKLIMDVNDPLRCLMKIKKEDSLKVFGGCIAGVGSFSVEPDGWLMPCPLMHNQKILNVKGRTGQEIFEEYINNDIIHNLLDRKLEGKCGACKYKYACGGCRARAEAVSGSYLGSDSDCFLSLF